MYFEWDAKKAASNLRKHDAGFEEATSTLRDMLSATARDPDHSEGEARFVTFGVYIVAAIMQRKVQQYVIVQMFTEK